MSKKGIVVSIKGVDPYYWQSFKKRASLLGLSMGKAFNQALELWLFVKQKAPVLDEILRILEEGVEVE